MLFLILLTSFYANAESRFSNVGLTRTNGPDEYSSVALDGLIALGDKWAFTASAFQSDSGVANFLDEELVSTEVRLGANWQMTPTWNLAAEVISRQDPYEVRGRGAGISIGSKISDFWQGKKDTVLKFKVEQLRYSQELTLQGPFVTLEVDRAVTQKSAVIALDQEFADWISASLTHTRYNYTEEANKLALTTARRRTSLGGNGPTYGLPDRISALEFVLYPLEWLETRLGVARSKILEDDTVIKTNSIGLSLFWKSWQLDVDGSQTDYGDSSGDDEEKQNYVSLGIGYTW